MFYEKFQKEPISFNCALFWTAWWNLTSSCSGWGSPLCPVHLHRTCYLHVGRLAVSVTNRFSYWLWERQGDTARETSHSRNCHNGSFALFDVLLSPPVPILLLSQQCMYRRKKHSMYKVWSHPVSGIHCGSWKVSPWIRGNDCVFILILEQALRINAMTVSTVISMFSHSMNTLHSSHVGFTVVIFRM